MRREFDESFRPGEVDPAVLDRFLANECTAEESARIAAWYAADPVTAVAIERVRTGFQARRRIQAFDTGNAAVRRVAHVIASHDDAVARASRRRPRAWQLGVGASVLITLAAVFIARWRELSPASHADMTHYATKSAQRSSVTLPDGSRVTLAPDSRLSYSADRSGARTLTLSGQAYFVVAHDGRHPFIVRTGRVSTRVLGTAFDVRHYASDSAVRVVVVDGKVAASGRGAPVLLVAGMRGEMTDSTATVVTNDNVDDVTAWVRGRLVFTDTPVPVMLQTLRRWYGYEFRLADSTLTTRQVTAMFSINDTAKTMTALKALLQVTMTFDGSVVVLRPVHHSGALAPRSRRWQDVPSPNEEIGK
jgi:transmembrane sensor